MSRPDHADFCNKDHQPGSTPCARIVPAKGPATDADSLYQPRPGRTYGVEPEVALTPLELMQLPEGDTVYDAQGDAWVKEDGKWVCRDARLLPESLIHVWGPITMEEQ